MRGITQRETTLRYHPHSIYHYVLLTSRLCLIRHFNIIQHIFTVFTESVPPRDQRDRPHQQLPRGFWWTVYYLLWFFVLFYGNSWMTLTRHLIEAAHKETSSPVCTANRFSGAACTSYCSSARCWQWWDGPLLYKGSYHCQLCHLCTSGQKAGSLPNSEEEKSQARNKVKQSYLPLQGSLTAEALNSNT